MRDELRSRIDLIEEAYEFMLAYAAQGLLGDAGSSAGGELRTYLDRLDQALDGLGGLFRKLIASEIDDTREAFLAFVDVLEHDENHSRAVVGLVRAQPSISSQMIDNLNASMHIRALLTDIFLIDEILTVPETGAGSTS